MDIYEALKKDHEDLKPLLEQLVHATEVNEGTKELIQEIRDHLIPHARAEEAVFYNSLRRIDFVKDNVRHGYSEHLQAETLLRSLQAMTAVGIEWTKAAKALQSAILHHMEEEETELFQIAEQVLTKEETIQMAKAFEKMKPAIREDGMMKNTVDLIANLMPQRFSESFRSTHR